MKTPIRGWYIDRGRVIYRLFENYVSWTELELLRSTSGFIYFCAVVLIAIISVRIYQILFVYKRNGIQYEEEPEPIVLDFDYKTPPHQKENR